MAGSQAWGNLRVSTMVNLPEDQDVAMLEQVKLPMFRDLNEYEENISFGIEARCVYQFPNREDTWCRDEYHHVTEKEMVEGLGEGRWMTAAVLNPIMNLHRSYSRDPKVITLRALYCDTQWSNKCTTSDITNPNAIAKLRRMLENTHGRAKMSAFNHACVPIHVDDVHWCGLIIDWDERKVQHNICASDAILGTLS